MNWKRVAIQEAKVSRSGISFSMPNKNIKPDLLTASAQICEANEDIKQCTSTERRFIPLFSKGLEVPSCGSSGLTYYLHWSRAMLSLTSTPGKERDHSLPGEIIEGRPLALQGIVEDIN